MLLEFRFKNCFSFKNETVVSFIKDNKDLHHTSNLTTISDKVKVFKTMAFFGANASGKTNINRALTFAILFIRNSNKMTLGEKINVIPFLFDEESKFKDSSFSFTFLIDNKKYIYGFSLNREKVNEEYLYVYESQKKTLVFLRKNNDEFKFNDEYKKEFKLRQEFLTPNRLFLEVAANNGLKIVQTPYLFFINKIETIDSERIKDVFLDLMEQDIDGKLKKYSLDFLKAADINVSDFDLNIERKDELNNDLPFMITLKNSSNINNIKIRNIDMKIYHRVNLNSGYKDYEIPYQLDSNGTIKALSIAPIIKKTLDEGKTLFIDEIDVALHSEVLRYIISLFNSKNINKNNAQLVFNSHNQTLIDVSIFRMDQIKFVNKGNDGVSSIYSLDDFNERYSKNIIDKYQKGEFGGTPNVDIIL